MSILSIYRTPVRSDIGWHFVAVLLCTFSVFLWYLPGGSQITQWLSTTTEKYCEALTVLAESVAEMCGFRGTGSHTIPGAYLDTHALRTNRQQNNISINISQHSIHTDIKHNGEMLNGSKPQSGDQYPNQESDIGALGYYINPSSPYLDRSGARPSLRADGAKSSTATSVVSTLSSIPELRPQTKQERDCKYAKMRTLKLPGKPSRPIKPPTGNELAVRRANERAAIEACQREKYCARELAGDGIFMHAPATKARFEPGVIEYCHAVRQARRETSVGPMNASWRNRHAMAVPTIRISEPDDMQIQVTFSEPRHLSPPCPSSTPADHISSEPNKFYIPPKALLPVFAHIPSSNADSAEDELGVYHTYFSESNLRYMVNYKRKVQTERSQRLYKNRTSMSDWLATIGTGNNSLVAEHVAEKAGPVLRASPILSPVWTPTFSPTYSTSDSSGPSTPIEEFRLPLPVIQEMRGVGTSGDGHRRRARCSYLGDGYDVVVAPSIPEELVTDEIGIAC
ncbi:unnamed protein product [Rhizoctonia solani]|uniref:Uncharacterized protein n=1 Tax=Rhizoctonia solani TaxID=456999 RepID=A0A8H3AZ45_9AGAM|nr:unnamed protein product [Rhizoctonia solani]